MPELVKCPACSRQLRVPDDLIDKMVKCPQCKEPFLAQTESGSKDDEVRDDTPVRKSGGREVGVSTGPRSSDVERPPLPSLRRTQEEDEDHPYQPGADLDDDYGRPRVGSRAGWKSVRLGLNLFIIGCYVIIGAFILGGLGLAVALLLLVISGTGALAALSSSNPNPGMAGATGAGLAGGIVAIVSGGLIALGFVVKIVLQGIGQVFMLRIPDERGTGQRPLAIAALSVWGADILLYLSGVLLSCMGTGLGPRSGGSVLGLGANCATLISYLCMIGWYFVFMFLLRAIAQRMRSRGVARGIIAHMIAVPVFVVLAIFSFVGVFCVGGIAAVSFASRSSAGSGAAIGIGWIIAAIVMYVLILLIELALYIWYVVILHQVRGAIDTRLGG